MTPARLFLALLASVPALCLAAIDDYNATRDFQCFVSGECFGSTILETSLAVDSNDCLTRCQGNKNCSWFTFHQDTKVCLAMAGCFQISAQLCPECVSGQRQCPQFQCGVPGRCLGMLVDIRKVRGEFACHRACLSIDKCRWHTYDPDQHACLMTNDCPKVNDTCSRCTAWERECFTAKGLEEQVQDVLSGLTTVELAMLTKSMEQAKEEAEKKEEEVGEEEGATKAKDTSEHMDQGKDEKESDKKSSDDEDSRNLDLSLLLSMKEHTDPLLIDLGNQTGAGDRSECKPIPQLEHLTNKPILAMLGDKITACGGGEQVQHQSCYHYDKTIGDWIQYRNPCPEVPSLDHPFIMFQSKNLLMIGTQENPMKTQIFNGSDCVLGPEMDHDMMYGCAAVAKDNSIYVTGSAKTENARKILKLDWDTMDWSLLDTELPAPARSGMSCMVLEGKLILAGGQDDTDQDYLVLNDVDVLDLEKGMWSKEEPLPDLVDRANNLAYHGSLLIAGGQNEDESLTSLYHYQPEKEGRKRWALLKQDMGLEQSAGLLVPRDYLNC